VSVRWTSCHSSPSGLHRRVSPSGPSWRTFKPKLRGYVLQPIRLALSARLGQQFLITSGCTGWAPNAARLAVAEWITGPWKPLGNPCRGEKAEITFDGQGTYILPEPGSRGFIFMADRWRPKNAIDGRYLWLPIRFHEGHPVIEWVEEWDLSVFAGTKEARSGRSAVCCTRWLRASRRSRGPARRV
jgi:hypothetical protein